MAQVIEWKNPSSDDVVWRYPDENITWGAQLIIHEYETAVFFRDGKAYDVLGAGRHMLTTLNLPLLTGVLSRIAGYRETPFKAAVIFISTRNIAGKFGMKAQTTELAPLQMFGSFWFKVENPQLFVMEVVGGKNAYTTSEVDSYIRGFVNERMIDEISKYDLASVFTKLDETSMAVKNAILDAFRRIGLDLVDLKFEGIPRKAVLAKIHKNGTRNRPENGNGERSSQRTGQIGGSRTGNRNGAHPTNYAAHGSRSCTVSCCHAVPQLQRPNPRNVEILPRMRSETGKADNGDKELPEMRKISSNNFQVLS
jgi:hypothetical protein